MKAASLPTVAAVCVIAASAIAPGRVHAFSSVPCLRVPGSSSSPQPTPHSDHLSSMRGRFFQSNDHRSRIRTQRTASIIVPLPDDEPSPLSPPTVAAPNDSASKLGTAESVLNACASLEGIRSTLDPIASTAVFIVLDKLLRSLFLCAGISFPSQLAGCGLLFVTMAAFPTVGLRLYPVLRPGAVFLAKWLQVFLVPSLIHLPLAPSFSSSSEAFMAATIIGGGFCASLLLTAYSVLGVRRVTNRACDNPRPEPNCAEPASAAVSGQLTTKPYSDSTMRTLRSLMVISGILAGATAKTALLPCLTTTSATAFMLFSTVHNFVLGARMPKNVTKVLHPLVTCTTLTWLCASALAKVSGTTFHAVLRSFKTHSLACSIAGAGDMLLFMLPPAIFSLGVSMYDRRRLMRENMAEVATSVGVSSASGLFGTAIAVRVLMSSASKTAALSLLSRNITSALAMITGTMIGANIPLTVSIAVVTGLLGANFGATLLNAFRIYDPVARGLSIGAASHGLGTAAIAGEKDAFPFAAIAMTLVASFSAALVSVPFVRRVLIQLAVGL